MQTNENTDPSASQPNPTAWMVGHKVQITIPWSEVGSGARRPNKAHYNDAGWDLYVSEDKTVPVGSRAAIATNIAIAVPDGYAGLLLGRSSSNGLGLFVLPSLIDPGYRGPVFVSCINLSNVEIRVRWRDRIAQLVILPVVDSLMSFTPGLPPGIREDRGFGSSGR